jgi:hypothetical protein
MMPQQLKTPQRQQRHEIAHVQAVRGGIKPRIKHHGPGPDPFQKLSLIGAVGNEAAPFEFFVNIHPQAGLLAIKLP